MLKTPTIERDERTIAVENAGYRWSCILLTYALLIDVMYRAIIRNEAAWDLLGLVILSGIVSVTYQVRQKTLPALVLIICVLGAVGAIVAVIMVSAHN